MRFDHAKGGRLLTQMVKDSGQHDVLVHVGEIAGMEGVLIVHARRSGNGGCRLSEKDRLSEKGSRDIEIPVQPPRTGGMTS
jgi:hypothetical protein